MERYADGRAASSGLSTAPMMAGIPIARFEYRDGQSPVGNRCGPLTGRCAPTTSSIAAVAAATFVHFFYANCGRVCPRAFDSIQGLLTRMNANQHALTDPRWHLVRHQRSHPKPKRNTDHPAVSLFSVLWLSRYSSFSLYSVLPTPYSKALDRPAKWLGTAMAGSGEWSSARGPDGAGRCDTYRCSPCPSAIAFPRRPCGLHRSRSSPAATRVRSRPPRTARSWDSVNRSSPTRK